MKVTSNWTAGKAFWRTFDQGDTVFIAGRWQGLVSNGDSFNVNNGSPFKMEIKRLDIFGPFIIRPGQLFTDDQELVLTDKGELITRDDSAHVELDPGYKFENVGSTAQFISLLNSTIDVEYDITTSISQEQTAVNSNSSKLTTSATTTSGTKLGAGATGEGKAGEIKIGVNTDVAVSDTVENKIEKEITNQFSFTSSTKTAYTETHKVTGKAGKITVYTYAWQRQYVTGRVKIGQDIIPFEATMAYITSPKIDEYASIAALPAELFDQYNKLFPSTTVITDTTPKILHLEIQNKYKQINAERLSNKIPPVGDPENAEQTSPDGVGRYQHYKTGESIYWHPATGAHLIYGLIKAKWAKLGWERSPMGYPATDERDTGTGPGRYNNFQNGCVIWRSGNNEAFAVYGNAYQLWGQQSYDAGILGFPTSDRYLINMRWRQNFSNQKIIDIVE